MPMFNMRVVPKRPQKMGSDSWASLGDCGAIFQRIHQALGVASRVFTVNFFQHLKVIPPGPQD